MRFLDRTRAGEELADAVHERLAAGSGADAAGRGAPDPGTPGPQAPEGATDPAPAAGDAVVLALPRGGVPVAAPVARVLGAPLDVLLVRKLGVPNNPELAMGAVAEGDVQVLNEGLVRQLDVTDDWIRREVDAQTRELERRGRRYRGDAPAAALAGRTVVIVDDGIATGATVRAAVRGVRAREPGRMVVAVPTAAPDSVRMLEDEVDVVVCLHAPDPFRAVAVWYESFPQVDDEEVVRLLAQNRREAGPE